MVTRLGFPDVAEREGDREPPSARCSSCLFLGSLTGYGMVFG